MRNETGPGHAGALACLFCLACLVSLSLLSLIAPGPKPGDAPADEFSAIRALESVKTIARAPHPPGSDEHARVGSAIRESFSAQKLLVRFQETVALHDDGDVTVAAPVRNIVARRPGNGGGKTVLFTAHYDSHPTGPGASDDAAGVAALIETARALGSIPLKNDLLFVITDAEEIGLLGAEGFLQAAPEARDTKTLVVNFEARGGGGPSYLFETSDGNESLMGEVARAGGPRLFASSLTYALYKLLPNDTDLTVFKRAGFSGLNFAFLDRWQQYHTALDTPDRLDLRSLQQHGDYALSLAKHLGDADVAALAETNQRDAIYFDVLGRVLVRYPTVAAWPLTGFATLLWIVAMILRRRGRGFWGGFFAGLLLVPVTVAAAFGLGALVGSLVAPTRAGMPWGNPYVARWTEFGLYFGALAVASGCWCALWRRLPTGAIWLGAQFWWIVALALATQFLPGGSFLLLWPCVFSLIPTLVPPDSSDFRREARPGDISGWLALACAIPALFLWPPILHGFWQMLGYSMTGPFAALAAFALIPTLGALAVCRFWPSLILGVGALGCIVFAAVPRAPTAENPRVSSLIYFEDSTRAEALWATADRTASAWTGAKVPQGAPTRPGSELFPWWSGRDFRVSPAPRKLLPTVEVRRSGDRLTVLPARGMRELVVASDAPIRSASLNGRALRLYGDSRLRLRFAAPPPEGITLKIDAPRGIGFSLDGLSDGLPHEAGVRPPDEIPAPIAPATDIRVSRRRIFW